MVKLIKTSDIIDLLCDPLSLWYVLLEIVDGSFRDNRPIFIKKIFILFVFLCSHLSEDALLALIDKI